jgi:hypothetical protein
LCPENKYELIFDEKVDGPKLEEVFREKANVIGKCTWLTTQSKLTRRN